MALIRVLVVEDSLTVRRRLCEVLSQDPEIEVVGEAEDGKRAIELCAALRPSAITMDMMLPVMTGLAATEHIMAHYPTPILIVSSSVNRGELFKTYDALAAGAVDVLEKPNGNEPDGVWEQQFRSTVKLISRIRVITHPRARLTPVRQTPTSTGRTMPAQSFGERCEVVAIGASTGGPLAIVEILRSIRRGFELPIILVLHINEPFGSAFAEWLDGQSPHPVSYAKDGGVLADYASKVVMAPPGRHLVVGHGRLRLTSTPERHSCRPSIDVLFESMASEYGPRMIACLLTGMGRDGATGLLDIRRAGGRTIAQDEATSVIYGMPREAAIIGAAERILPLSDIGPTIESLARPSARRGS